MTTSDLPLRALLVLGLALPAWYGSLATDEAAHGIVGPLAVATGPAGVYVAAPGRLYLLDNAGKPLARHDDVIEASARDAGIATLPDGTLLAAPGAGGALVHCADDGGGCAPFATDDYAPKGPQQLTVADDVVWISETRADRVLRYKPDGSRIDMPVSMGIDAPGTVLQVAGTLYIVDGNGQRIRRYQLEQRGIEEDGELATFAAPGNTLPDHPLRLAPRGDGWWLLLDDLAHRRGQLATLDAQGALDRLAVPGLVRPVSMTALGDDLLIVDEGAMQVLRRSADGKVAPFGDAAWRATLAEKRSLRDALRIASPLLLVLAALLAAAGGFFVVRHLVSRFVREPSSASAGADGVTWVPRIIDAARARLPADALAALPAALFPALVAAKFGHTGVGVAWALLAVGAWVAWLMRGVAQLQPPNDLKLGVRRDRLVVADTEGGLREFPLASVGGNAQALVPAPGKEVPLVANGAPLFVHAVLQSVVLAKLDPKKYG